MNHQHILRQRRSAHDKALSHSDVKIVNSSLRGNADISTSADMQSRLFGKRSLLKS
jgi:predicted nucleic acid-binding protein